MWWEEKLKVVETSFLIGKRLWHLYRTVATLPGCGQHDHNFEVSGQLWIIQPTLTRYFWLIWIGCASLQTFWVCIWRLVSTKDDLVQNQNNNTSGTVSFYLTSTYTSLLSFKVDLWSFQEHQHISVVWTRWQACRLSGIPRMRMPAIWSCTASFS